MGGAQEVAHTEVSDLNFFDNTVHICPKPHRNYRLKSKRNRNGNVGDRYVPIHTSLMTRLKEYIERKRLREGDLLFANLDGNVEGHYLRKLQAIAISVINGKSKQFSPCSLVQSLAGESCGAGLRSREQACRNLSVG